MRRSSDEVLALLSVVVLIGCGEVKRPDANDAMVDAMPDAMIDSPPDADLTVRYDIAYVDEFTFTPSISGVAGFLLVVNKGVLPLNLSEISVVSFIDDDPDVRLEFAKAADATMPLPPGRAAGSLSEPAAVHVIDSGIVTEPVEDPFLNFRISFLSPALTETTINARAVLRIDGKDATLPFVIHIVSTASSFNGARRVSSQP
jgi:hypothetical protein